MIEQVLEEKKETILPGSPPFYYKKSKKRFSRVAWGALLLTVCFQLLGLIPRSILGVFATYSTFVTTNLEILSSIITVLLIGAPLMYFYYKEISKPQPLEAPAKLDGLTLVKWIIISLAVMYFLNFFAQLINSGLCKLFDFPINDLLNSELVQLQLPLTILYMVIIAPIFEEIVFRKLMIDSLRDFGDLPIIIFSSILFGLMHANLTQAIYATGLGIILGYVYVKYHNIKAVIIIHMVVNLFGSLIFGVLITNEVVVGLSVIAILIIGAILLISLRKKIHFNKSAYNLTTFEHFKLAYLNFGFITYLIVNVLLIIFTFFMLGIMSKII